MASYRCIWLWSTSLGLVLCVFFDPAMTSLQHTVSSRTRSVIICSCWKCCYVAIALSCRAVGWDPRTHVAINLCMYISRIPCGIHQGSTARLYFNRIQVHLGRVRISQSYFTKAFAKSPSESCPTSAAKAHTNTPWLATLPVTDCHTIAATHA